MRYFNSLVVVSLLLLVVDVPQSALAQDTTSAPPIEFLLETIRQADQIDDEKTRAKAQSGMVRALVNASMSAEAFDQAMKFSQSNPHGCILSMETIGKDALKRNDSAMVERAFLAAAEVDRNSSGKYTYQIVATGFKLDRPLGAILGVVKQNGPSPRVLRDIRHWLARKGRVDEAFQFAATHLSGESKLQHQQQIACVCAMVKQLDHSAKHDHFGQAIAIINQMPIGKERDQTIAALVRDLMYKTYGETVSDDNLALASHWAEEIQDEFKRDLAKIAVKQRTTKSDQSVQQLEKRFSEAKLREEKSKLLSRIFRLLIDAENLEEADKILPRQLQLIEEQPRIRKPSKFGPNDDQTSIILAKWRHERTMVAALAKVGKLEEAKARLKKMADLPQRKHPVMFIGTLSGIRQGLMLELGEFDELKQMVEETNPNQTHLYALLVTTRLVSLGQLEEATREFQTVLDQPQEIVFAPEQLKTLGPFGLGPLVPKVHQALADALVKSGDVEAAVRVLNQIPDHKGLTAPFKSFGRTLCADGNLDKLKPWLEKLPHQTARVHARLAAWNVASKKKKEE